MNARAELGAQLGKVAPQLEATPGQVSERYVWYVIFLLFVVNVCNYVDRTALAVLLPLIKVDLHLSDAQSGLLIGLGFSVFYAICGIPIARWADKGIRRDIIVIALTTWSIMTALSGAAKNFWHLFGARIGIGAGEAGCLPPSQSIICDYVPLRRRSGIFAIHSIGLVAGMVLGMALSGWLGETIGWRWTFVVLGVPGLVLAVVVRFTLREPVRGRFDISKDEAPAPPFREVIGFLWQSRTYRLLTLLGVTNGFVQYGLNQWWPSFYVRVFDLSPSFVGLRLGVAIGLGSGIGLLIGGLLANKAARHDIRYPLMIGAAATAMSFPAAFSSLFVSSADASMLLVAVATLLWSVSNGPVIANLMSIARPRMRATAGSINIFFTSVLGFGLGPLCVGLLSDHLTPTVGVHALRYALVVPVCLIPVMVFALYAAAQRLPQDLKAAGSQ